jgi:tetratricopeptide (TPR) repeat protein
VLHAASLWSEGCAALERGDASLALARFDAAAEAAPEGRLFPLSAALALAALERIEEADDRLALLWEWRSEPRYAVASAWVGLARPDLDRALEALRDPAREALDEDARPGGDDSVLAQLTEQYYYVLLWKEAYDDAQDYALRMDERSGRAGVPGAFWTVRAADASFYRRDTALARELYERALGAEKDNGALCEIYLKLADLAYLAGDHATERRLREHYYGRLEE